MLLFRDVDEKGEVWERVLGIIFVTKDDLLELRKLQQKPFGHEATWGRIQDLLQSRFCTSEVSARNFLPHRMRTLYQMSYDGASMNHSLHRYVRDTFISDLLPRVDDCHQLEHAAVHAFRSDPFVKEVLGMEKGVNGDECFS